MADTINTLEELRDKLLSKFSSNTTLADLAILLEKYNGTDWKKYINFSEDTYYKKLLYQTSAFDIYLICWKKNQQSKIHDHPSNGCLMKVLEGSLLENIYQNDYKLVYKESKILKENDIGYRVNNLILHDIRALDDAVSIHIYSPNGYKTKYY